MIEAVNLHKSFGHVLEGGIHRLRIDFNANQFFAGRQIFNRYIHKQTFPSKNQMITPDRPAEYFAAKRVGEGR